ncbi:unnamed protein product [Acanthosepion pharaonis]|uniref:Uncharacterized protein n=1 Tax=Acanthosepion pharaonis TaxID=158019 RepID=A0A812C779_ACAPH|nr:unnamed protein product [Sepia pharaonis]
MDKLPTTITQILAPIADNTPLDQLANSADRIATKLDQGMCAVQRPDDTPAKDTDLEKAVADLQHQLQDIRMLLSRKSRGPRPAVGDREYRVPAGIDESTRNYDGTTTDSAPGQDIARQPANTAPKLNRKTKLPAGSSIRTPRGARVWHASLLTRTIFPPSAVLFPPSAVQPHQVLSCKICATKWPNLHTLPHDNKPQAPTYHRNWIPAILFLLEPLTPSYQGPFKVLKRSNKFVTIMRGKDKDTVSTDRLKPDWLEETSPDPDFLNAVALFTKGQTSGDRCSICLPPSCRLEPDNAPSTDTL